MSEAQVANAREELLRRISSEFVEMPGLRLTSEQAQRLWGLDPATCAGVLADLIASNFLARTADGRYARRSDAAMQFPAPRMARASLPPFAIKRVG